MYYFLTYNDGTHIDFMEKLIESVKQFGKQFNIIIFNKNDIDANFSEVNKHILDLPRGGGYWLWKPYIIHETMKRLNTGDILFYLDSKYYFTEDFDKLYEPLLKYNDIVIWKNKPNDDSFLMKNYCKMDIIQKYDMYDKIFNQDIESCWAGAICIRKNDDTLKIIEEWLNMCTIGRDITDEPSMIANRQEFIEHRHDQSLLTIILHKNNIPFHYFVKCYLQNVRSPY
jgi:hypothetical protein